MARRAGGADDGAFRRRRDAEKLPAGFGQRSSGTTLSRISEFLWNEPSALERRPIVVGTLHRARGQLHLLARCFLVGDQAEQVTDAVETGAPLVIRGQDVPGGELRVGGLKHDVARLRICEPFASRAQVRRAQLPLAQRIRDAGAEAALLLLLAHLKPELDEQDAIVNNISFELGANFKEAPVLRRRTEAHHVLDSSPVIPAAVEDHDFTGRWEVLNVALHVKLGLFAV